MKYFFANKSVFKILFFTLIIATQSQAELEPTLILQIEKDVVELERIAEIARITPKIRWKKSSFQCFFTAIGNIRSAFSRHGQDGTPEGLLIRDIHEKLIDIGEADDPTQSHPITLLIEETCARQMDKPFDPHFKQILVATLTINTSLQNSIARVLGAPLSRFVFPVQPGPDYDHIMVPLLEDRAYGAAVEDKPSLMGRLETEATLSHQFRIYWPWYIGTATAVGAGVFIYQRYSDGGRDVMDEINFGHIDPTSTEETKDPVSISLIWGAIKAALPALKASGSTIAAIAASVYGFKQIRRLFCGDVIGEMKVEREKFKTKLKLRDQRHEARVAAIKNDMKDTLRARDQKWSRDLSRLEASLKGEVKAAIDEYNAGKIGQEDVVRRCEALFTRHTELVHEVEGLKSAATAVAEEVFQREKAEILAYMVEHAVPRAIQEATLERLEAAFAHHKERQSWLGSVFGAGDRKYKDTRKVLRRILAEGDAAVVPGVAHADHLRIKDA